MTNLSQIAIKSFIHNWNALQVSRLSRVWYFNTTTDVRSGWFFILSWSKLWSKSATQRNPAKPIDQSPITVLYRICIILYIILKNIVGLNTLNKWGSRWDPETKGQSVIMFLFGEDSQVLWPARTSEGAEGGEGDALWLAVLNKVRLHQVRVELHLQPGRQSNRWVRSHSDLKVQSAILIQYTFCGIQQS